MSELIHAGIKKEGDNYRLIEIRYSGFSKPEVIEKELYRLAKDGETPDISMYDPDDFIKRALVKIGES